MNPAILREYRKFRGITGLVGRDAEQALRSARIVVAYREAKEASLVALVASPEPECYFDVYGEPEGYVNGNGHRVSAEQARAEMVDTLDRLGCWCVSARVRKECDKCGRVKWETVDSVSMCTGYVNPLSPYENVYVVDLMSAALKRLETITTKAG